MHPSQILIHLPNLSNLFPSTGPIWDFEVGLFTFPWALHRDWFLPTGLISPCYRLIISPIPSIIVLLSIRSNKAFPREYGQASSASYGNYLMIRNDIVEHIN